MTSDTTGTRANRLGDPCPDWCATNHDQPYQDSHVGRAGDAGGAARKVLMAIDPGTSLYPEERRVVVYPMTGCAALTARTDLQAGQLADFLDGIAAMNEDAIRELAAAVRATAEDLFR